MPTRELEHWKDTGVIPLGAAGQVARYRAMVAALEDDDEAVGYCSACGSRSESLDECQACGGAITPVEVE